MSFMLSVSVGCGEMSSENCTYFNSEAVVQAGACRATICPCGSDICQASWIPLSFIALKGKLLSGQ